MATLNFTVDPSQNEQVFGIVPQGEYIALIEKEELKKTKDGRGDILALTYQILDGPHKGSKVFEQLNIKNDSAIAQQIAHNKLNELGKIFGLSIVRDSAQLLGKPLIIDVIVKPGEKKPDGTKYDDKNEVKRHKAIDSKSPASQVQQTFQGSVVAPSENGGAPKQPWER